MSVEAIVTDIEGTTSSIHFVHNVLFPYARKNLAAYLRENANLPGVQVELEAVRELIDQPTAKLEHIIHTLEQWIDEDRKATPLKTLQGYVWKQGYEAGEYRSHMYDDAVAGLQRWHAAGKTLAIYSSGSVGAQKLLFGYTEFGDLNALFSHYFDTKVGAKREPQAYAAIVSALKLPAAKLLFLSDIEAELDAAAVAGLKTAWLIRDNQPDSNSAHPRFHSFDEIDAAFF